MQKFKFSLPAELCFTGDIIVTDPCYFIPDKYWREIIKSWYDGNDPTEFANAGVITFDNGIKILYSSTAYGDGTYPIFTKRGNGESVHEDVIGVDAGMIAVISVDDVQKLNKSFNINDEDYPRINNFDGCIKADGNGNFIGDLEVNTESEYEEEDYEEEDYEEEDYEDDDLF